MSADFLDVVAIEVKSESVTQYAFKPCVHCGRNERPGAVHFPTVAALRPCAGSWPEQRKAKP